MTTILIERSDPMATTALEQYLDSAVGDVTETYVAESKGDEFDEVDAAALARNLLDDFAVTWERKDGLRRLVLVGAWEVDPTTVTT